MIDLNSHDHEEIEQLLPWYEKGTLSAAEMQRVEAYLDTHPELRSRLALIREEVAETIAANESLGMPSPAVRDRLMEQIASEAGNSLETSSGFKSWISGFLPGRTFSGARNGRCDGSRDYRRAGSGAGLGPVG